ncbi:ATP-binding protein [Arthrobacter sp. Z4-13]
MSGDPAILVMEGNDPALCRRFLALDAVRMVVLIDPAAALTFVGVDNPRWTELANVVRAVVQDSEACLPGAADDRVRVVDAEWFTSNHRQDFPLDRGGLESIMRWLELCLALRLSDRGDNGNSGVPGWSVTPCEAINMLLGDAPGKITMSTPLDLNERLRDAESDLFVSGRTLPRDIIDIRDAFNLSSEELRFLVLVLAPEFDGRFATAIGVLQDDLTRRRPGLTLIAELLSDTEQTSWDLRRSLIGPDSLAGKGLLRAEPEGLAVEAPLVPSAAVVAYLLSDSPDQIAATVGARLWQPTAVLEPPFSFEEERLARQLMLVDHDSGPVRLVGGDRSGRWFGRLVSGLDLALLVGNLHAGHSGEELTLKASDWCVLSRLMDSGLLLLGTETLTEVERSQIGSVVLSRARERKLVAADGDLSDGCGQTSSLVLEAPGTSAAQRSAWWATAALHAGLLLDEAGLERLAATVNVDPDDYASAVGTALRLVAAGVGGTLVELVQRSARELTLCELPAGVRRIEPVYGWNDIILGEESRNLLESIPQHVLYEGRVMEEWGFAARMAYGRGVSALFSGPSGTGKTMAAQIIAKDLGVDLLQVDLSKTVSKYIGDTEKNLDRVFEAAECSGSVLLFDEADAIFGRRTEIKDAHDRHANVEVAYLLQRLESFRGLTILTTNLKQNIDNAFARRLRFVIEFTLPTAAERVKLWQKAFPEGVLADGDPDVAAIASRLPIAGGSIQNIALHAAFLAAPEDGPIGVRHLFAALRRELLKLGMRTALSSLEEYMPVIVRAGGIDPRVAS